MSVQQVQAAYRQYLRRDPSNFEIQMAEDTLAHEGLNGLVAELRRKGCMPPGDTYQSAGAYVPAQPVQVAQPVYQQPLPVYQQPQPSYQPLPVYTPAIPAAPPAYQTQANRPPTPLPMGPLPRF